MPVIMFENKELLGLIVDTAGQLVAIKCFNISASMNQFYLLVLTYRECMKS